MLVVHPNISAETRISSQALPARHLQLVKLEPAIVDESDQVQECASEEADLSLTTTLNVFYFESLNFPVFCGCSRVQNLQAPKGLWTASKAFKLHANHRTL